MNDSDSKEFQEWYSLMKERTSQILKDTSLTDEQKQVFIERSTEPIGTWKVSKMRSISGVGALDKLQSNGNGIHFNNGTLDSLLEKYKLIRDEKGIKVSSFIQDWNRCNEELQREGYTWNRETRHFVKTDL